MKKMFAIVLALVLCISALSVVAFAAPEGIESLAIVGSGIPGVEEWKPESDSGNMTEVSNNVYEKVLEVTAPVEMKIKFAANDMWDGGANLGGTSAGLSLVIGETMELANDGGSSDLTLSVTEPCTLKVTVDLNAFAEGGAATVLVTGVTAGGEAPEQPEQPEQPETPEVPADATYYVAGTAALCNDKEWDAGAAENVMTKGDDGIWTITYTGVAAGSYALKVTDGTWTNSWGGNGENGNFEFTIEETADITVKFNPETQKVTVLNGSNPITGDMSLAAVSVALLAATAGLVVTVSKKKEF